MANNQYRERIIGVLEKDGDYNGNSYSNYVLVTINEVNAIDRSCDCTSYKFKKCDCEKVTGTKDPRDLIGTYIALANFDKYHRLSEVVYE